MINPAHSPSLTKTQRNRAHDDPYKLGTGLERLGLRGGRIWEEKLEGGGEGEGKIVGEMG